MAQDPSSYSDSAATVAASADPAGSEDTPAANPESAPDNNPDPQEPSSADEGMKPGDIDTEFKSINSRLNDLTRIQGENEQKWKTEVQPYVDHFKEQVNAPDSGPPESVSDTVPPPTQQQRFNAGEAIVNVLKFGALLAIAYGSSARRGSAVRKAALAGAIGGWADAINQNRQNGRRTSDAAYKLWEKQREFDKDQRQQQMANYRAILSDKRLQLNQQMDLIKMTADQYKDFRMASDAERKDLLAVQANLQNMWKLHKDAEQQHLKDRHTIQDMVGRQGEADRYYVWVRDKFGAKIDSKTPIEEYDKLPEAAKYTEFLKEEDLRKSKEKKQSSYEEGYAHEKGALKAKEEDRKSTRL